MFSLLMKKHFVVGLSEGNNRGKKFERLRYYSSGLIAERGDCLPSDAALVGLHLTGVLTLPFTMTSLGQRVRASDSRSSFPSPVGERGQAHAADLG